jgi:GTPase SAR1 family protein
MTSRIELHSTSKNGYRDTPLTADVDAYIVCRALCACSSMLRKDYALNVIVICGCLSIDCFDKSIRSWITQIQQNTDTWVNKILIGNKCDLVQQRVRNSRRFHFSLKSVRCGSIVTVDILV